MREGWAKDHYLILFEEPEVIAATDRYQLSQFLPGYDIIGLRGWDDFLLRDTAGFLYSVPTVPLAMRYLGRLSEPPCDKALEADVRFTGKIKWYVKPIVFGGNPTAQENTVWVDHAKHVELVRWWKNRYRDLSLSSSNGQ
jgi:hypothetical protein